MLASLEPHQRHDPQPGRLIDPERFPVEAAAQLLEAVRGLSPEAQRALQRQVRRSEPAAQRAHARAEARLRKTGVRTDGLAVLSMTLETVEGERGEAQRRGDALRDRVDSGPLRLDRALLDRPDPALLRMPIGSMVLRFQSSRRMMRVADVVRYVVGDFEFIQLPPTEPVERLAQVYGRGEFLCLLLQPMDGGKIYFGGGHVEGSATDLFARLVIVPDSDRSQGGDRESPT